MRYTPVPSRLFVRNRQKLIKMMEGHSLALFTSNDQLARNGDQYYPYRQSSNLFYLSGLEQEKCILALSPGHPNKKFREIVFCAKPDKLSTKWYGEKYSKEDVQNISGVETVIWMEQFNDVLRGLILNAQYVYLDLNEYPGISREVVLADQRLAEKIRKDYPAHMYKRLGPLMMKLRMNKEAEEIKLMQKAADITASAFQRVLRRLRPGMYEYEIEAELSHEFISKACNGHAYQPIVASGKNALILHYTANSSKCKDGELLLMDFGAEYANYAADCSRTIPVNGKFTKRQLQCYNAVLRVQKKALQLYVPGNNIDTVNKEVRKMMENEMIGLGLFTKEDMQNQDPQNPLSYKYLMHGVCHPLGLDVHDVGEKYESFQKGMVFTLEPGLYIADENIGIRIENDIMVDEKPVDLTGNIPREANEIEAIMADAKKQ